VAYQGRRNLHRCRWWATAYERSGYLERPHTRLLPTLRRTYKPHQLAVRNSPTLVISGSSETRSTTVSSTASIACACQHGIAATSPCPSISEKLCVSAKPSVVIRALPLDTA